jgi:hypothetical protein
MISILYFSDLTPFKIRVLDFDWVTRSIGLIFFYKSKRHYFSKRK